MSQSVEEIKSIQGKMLLQMIGALLIFTAISVVFQGVMMLSMSLGGSEASVEARQQLLEGGYTVPLLVSIGVVYLILGLTQIFTGLFSFRLANRLDKVKILKIVAGIYTAVSLLQQAYLFLMGVTGALSWISAILMPGVLIWALRKNLRLAKADPKRIYVVDPSRTARGRQQPKKTTSLMQRAKAQVKDEELAARVAGETPEETQKQPQGHPVKYDDLEFVAAMNAAADHDTQEAEDKEGTSPADNEETEQTETASTETEHAEQPGKASGDAKEPVRAEAASGTDEAEEQNR
ncbi:MAG TPA: hypothetical protein IAA57_10505 [Candidatus Pullilachnospira intestinigallinarum]|nr:hypothetical protein [Candidatus Pullilachnospira intestinigallinarum]